MKAAPFAYHRPDSVKEAVDMLAEFGDDAKILAGGQSLVPMLAMRLTHFDNLIDISRIEELRNIELVDGAVRIAAGTPHAYVGMDDEVAESVPLLTLATPLIGHFQIRNRGTLGGAIAHADPAAEYAAVALALDAQIDALSSTGSRQIAATDFFTGLWETALAPDEILTAVNFPVWGGRSGFAVEEFARRHGDFAIAGAAVAVQLDDDDRVTRCGIGLLGLGSTPLRGTPAEEAITGRPVDDITADEIGRLALSGLEDIPSDLQGSAAYRARVGAVMVARAWTTATTEARDA
ncbi:aerobic-type carbon monoxide dehydrogenase, middle subunit CoxM/CutM-like protein [Mycolicibacterium phlei]|jgi:carbon-monoxide dehydrogenase medium subunit|uniref:Carbon-monoxide dehydrogenase n=1 Tax=Mycolicibacterium phlei DSM 43239 = CCUG 21000 TaxID=1226750 RepID=A0A5N5UUQ5_MYCPH|nr:xanthine dehydrogenase family protein subunit M [Mycolicibacterium phlei]VEG07595.1 aerobic-type carbon monoxide dehydrogenase, middle subunit CoxM/CutM-like protein [Mycobacteroides chelonae]AMO59465.1 6-hydroxypseudooxynicotine dehydrogenase complex subunit alpha [Mycolicibacterium phlei]EID09831.1 aerobic-type carbon monoxide dehydrogenase, middle subunit CoxM/CutM-like protein [Mycolicibacterium phlei RIVM601174]KAB7753305.1 carbon-monoxide dehydrogenase [Mycolicibacterium phlei DSM 4323